MICRFLLLTLVAFGIATPVLAETGTNGFCASTPQQMLAALDGQWSLKQGPGFALSAAGALPLPAHRAQVMTLGFNPQSGFSTLSGQGQQMAMAAGVSGDLTSVSNYLAAEEAEGLFSAGTGCEWNGLPIMIGSKTYELKEHVPGSNTPRLSMLLPIPSHPIVACIRQDGSVAASETFPDCTTPPRDLDADGDMKMTLIVKFQSANSGTGMLLFTGKSGSHSFFAKAPIKMTR